MTHRLHEPHPDTVTIMPENARITTWALRAGCESLDREVRLLVNGEPAATIVVPAEHSGEFYADVGDGIPITEQDSLAVTSSHHLDMDCLVEFTMPEEGESK